MKLRLPIAIVLLFTVINSNAQDISGEWKGNFGRNFLEGSLQKLIVILRVHDDSLIEGSSHLYYKGNKYEHYIIHGVYHKEDSSVYFSEDEEIDISLGFWGTNAMGNYRMKLTTYDSVLRLEGKWRENNNSFFSLLNSKVWLEKPVPKDTSKAIPPPASDIPDKNLDRKYEVQGAVSLEKEATDSLRIEITDNSTVDGDVISLYIDDSLVLHQQTITDTPIVLNLAVAHKKGTTRIKMAAESMGSVPPCTAHIIITTKSQRHEQDVWSNEATNGVIELKLND